MSSQYLAFYNLFITRVIEQTLDEVVRCEYYTKKCKKNNGGGESFSRAAILNIIFRNAYCETIITTNLFFKPKEDML